MITIAIEIAKKNAAENNVTVKFIHKSLFNSDAILKEQLFDLIVSNPPYVTQEDRLRMAERIE